MLATHGEIVIVSGEDEDAAQITGGVAVQYSDQHTGRILQMTAQRAVIFGEHGKLIDVSRMGANLLHAIYLEGDVSVSDGTQTIRGPQVCYDVRSNKAFMPDAVYWTYDQRRRLPLYVRAKSIKQESAREFLAKDAQVTNSAAFFDPELAIGASSVRITKQEREVPPADGATGPAQKQTETVVDARNVTVDVMGVPLFYWPWYSGDPSAFPIKDVRIENRTGSGTAIRSVLNAYALLGLARPKDITADLLLDYYFIRGPAAGAHLAWDEPGSRGGIQAYSVFNDEGTDILKSGARSKNDGDFRGFVTGEERWKLDEHWSILAEVSSISDPNFIEGFFQQMAEERASSPAASRPAGSTPTPTSPSRPRAPLTTSSATSTSSKAKATRSTSSPRPSTRARPTTCSPKPTPAF